MVSTALPLSPPATLFLSEPLLVTSDSLPACPNSPYLSDCPAFFMGWLLFPTNSYIELWILSTSEFKDKVFKEEIKLKWDHQGGLQFNITSVLMIRGIFGHRKCRGKTTWRFRELTVIRKLRTEALEETTLPILWSWISSLQNCEKINIYCLSHLVCGALLWQP